MRSVSESHAAVAVRPRPIADESAYGFLVRLTQANGFQTPRTFWSSLRKHHDGSLESVLAMFSLQPAEWSRLQGTLPSYCGLPMALPTGLAPDDVCHVTMRWCPQCLQTAPHLRAIWSVKLVCSCVIHGSLLLDQCPACGAVQRFERADITRCMCGSRLSEVAAPVTSSEVALVQHHLDQALRTARPDSGFNLRPENWCKLLRLAARAQDNGSRHRSGQVPGLHRLPVSLALNAIVGELLKNWPDGLHAVLSRLQAGAPHSFSIPRTFGRMYKWLYADLQDGFFQFMREGFESYLNMHWWGLVCERNRRLRHTTRRMHQRQSVKAAASAAEATPSVVQQLHLAGWIDANVISLPSGRQAWSIPASEIPAITSQLNDGINLQEAAALLGLAKRRVRELIDAKLIIPRLRSREGAAAWLLSRSEIEALARHCSGHCGAIKAPTMAAQAMGSSVRLNQVLKTWRLQEGEFPLLITAMLTGQICVAAGAVGHERLGELPLLVTSVKAWRQVRQAIHRELLSIDAASRLLGVKQEVGYQLVRAGLLESVADGVDQSRRVIPRTALKSFIERYVSLAELARAGQVSPRALLRRIQARPVCGPGIDGVRQYFFLQTDVGGRPSIPGINGGDLPAKQ